MAKLSKNANSFTTDIDTLKDSKNIRYNNTGFHGHVH